MSTHALIGIQNEDGTVLASYLHSDGYVQQAGQKLIRNYHRPVNVRELIALGDLSTLGSDIGTKHDFNDYQPDQTTAYGRDRGEDFPAAIYPSRQALVDSASAHHITYVYLFDGRDWKVYLDGVQYGSMVAALNGDSMS